MTVYQPATEILPALTDEALTTETYFKGDIAALLLTIPAEYRQPCEAEVTVRTSGYTVIHDVRTQVVAEIRAQLAR